MQTPAHTSDAALWAVRILSGFLAIVLLSHLAGCGGGDPDEPDQPTPRVDCTAHPDLCK